MKGTGQINLGMLTVITVSLDSSRHEDRSRGASLKGRQWMTEGMLR